MKIGTRLAIVSYVSLGMVALIGLAYTAINRQESRANHTAGLAAEMRKVEFERALLRDEYLLYRVERARVQWLGKTARFRELVALSEKNVTTPRDRTLLKAVRDGLDETTATFSAVVELHEGGRPGSPEWERRLTGQLFQQAYALSESVANFHALVLAEGQSTHGQGHIVLLVFIAGCAFVLFGISMTMRGAIAARVERLAASTAVIGSGDLDHRVELRGDDELASLGRATNEMAAKLQAAYASRAELQLEIDSRKQAAAALLRSERLLADSERIGKVGGWELNIDTGKQLWTEEVFRIHEVDSTFEPAVENGIGFYAPDSRPIIEGAVRRAIEAGEPFDVELEIITAKGNHRNVHAVGRADLEHRRVLGSFQDITERVRLAAEKSLLEDQLRQSQKVEAIGRLAGGVAHDFNNLTAIILGYGEMLLGRLGPEDPSRKFAEQIMAAGQRSAGLTRQLLAFSRKQTLQPEVLDLNALLRNLEQMFSRVIGEDVRLEFQLAAEQGRVLADPGQLEQAVTNLVVNARDAMPLGGSLTIETADVELDETYAQSHASVVPGRYVQLAVTDTGCGMDKATVDRLFEPFFTTKPRGKGTGLGLATVYGIVKQSGGHIWVYSEPGQGTTFKIYLPLTDAEPGPRDVRNGGEVIRGSGEVILLVEDEAPLRELCETVLTQLGYRVRAAASGEDALRLVQEQGLEPDLVLTDVIMSGMSATEMAQRLRAARPDLKVLYMSGYPDDAIARHGVLDPGVPFIQKPFVERALAAKVRESLREKAGAAKTVATAAGTTPEKSDEKNDVKTGQKAAVRTGEKTAVNDAAAQPNRRVLMIDDDRQFRELVQHFCSKRGHTFAGVDSAAAAIAALACATFDVLLVDLNIPGTSGEQILREIRDAGHKAPAIILTGDVASADMTALRPLGVTQALEKSSNAEPLVQAIEAA